MVPQREFNSYATFHDGSFYGAPSDLGAAPSDTFLIHFAGQGAMTNGTLRVAELVEHSSSLAEGVL